MPAVHEVDIGLVGLSIHGSDLSLSGMGMDTDSRSLMIREQSGMVFGADDESELPQETVHHDFQANEEVQAAEVETTLRALGFPNVQHLKDSVVDDD